MTLWVSYRLVDLAARTGLSTSTTHRLLTTLEHHKGEAAIAKRLPAASETTAANTFAAAPRQDLIHPGAMCYPREAGIARQAHSVCAYALTRLPRAPNNRAMPIAGV